MRESMYHCFRCLDIRTTAAIVSRCQLAVKRALVDQQLFCHLRPFQANPSAKLFCFVFIFRCVLASLWEAVRSSVGWLVRWSVGPLVGNAFVQIDEKWPFTDSKWYRQCWTRKKEGRGRKRDEEEWGMRRKEGRGGRRDEEEGAMWRKERWGEWKNKK